MKANTCATPVTPITAWLKQQTYIGGPCFLPPLLFKVLDTMPGFLQDVTVLHMFCTPLNAKRLRYRFDHFAVRCAAILAREEQLTLLEQVCSGKYDEHDGEPYA